jgi:plasmid stability protein
MATLYVENVPDDLYEALRSRAKSRRTSIAAEVLALLKENVPTAEELKARQALFERAIQLRQQLPMTDGPFPSAEEMIREDRER